MTHPPAQILHIYIRLIRLALDLAMMAVQHHLVWQRQQTGLRRRRLMSLGRVFGVMGQHGIVSYVYLHSSKRLGTGEYLVQAVQVKQQADVQAMYTCGRGR